MSMTILDPDEITAINVIMDYILKNPAKTVGTIKKRFRLTEDEYRMIFDLFEAVIMGGKRIDWQDDWLREHVLDSESYLILTDEYYKTFGTNINWRVIKSHCNYKLGIHKERKTHRHYTEEQLKFLSERYEKMGNRELLELFNSTFHENRTMSSMKNFGVQYHIQVDKCIRQANRRKRLDKDTSKRKTRNAGDTRIES